jgi:hypothetical protein
LRGNCLLQRVIEGNIKGGIEVTGRRGRWRRKLLDDLKERSGYSHLKEEAPDVWRARFGRGFGPVVRQFTKWMNSTACKFVKEFRHMFYIVQSIRSTYSLTTIWRTVHRLLWYTDRSK